MSGREKIRALIERVEQSKFPDRSLDREIEAAIGWPFALWTDNARPFTGVLDAAESLIPPVKWTIKSHDNLDISKRYWSAAVGRFYEHQGAAATPALALTAAALRARLAALEGGND